MIMGKELTGDMKEIKALEDKYGVMLFGMGLTHLVDAGFRSLGDEDEVERGVKEIMVRGVIDRENGVTPVMSPEFQCEILCCAAELAKFTPWTLFAYIKKHVHISNMGGV